MKSWLNNKLSTERKMWLVNTYRSLLQHKSHFIRYPGKTDLYNPLPPELLDQYNKQRQLGPKRLYCYVPYSNIFFNTFGYALSCCFNTKVILGRYPENTLKEIWQGNERKNLCEHLSHNDLSYGCEYCRYQLQTGKYTNLKASINDLYSTTSFKKYPKILEFELSNQCNLECIMCSGRVSSSIRKNRELMEPLHSPYDIKFVNQLDEFIPHAAEAKFFGGEPFLINIYYDIWDRILKLNPGMKVFALTNGSVFNEKIRNYIEKINFGIGISLDAMNKELYEKIRVNASYDTVMENILRYHHYFKKKKRGIGLSITPMSINWKEIPALFEFANSLQASVYVSFLEYPKRLALWNLPSEELKNISEHYKSVHLESKSSVEQYNSQCFSDLIKQIDRWIAEETHRNNPVRDGSLTEPIGKDHLFSSVAEAKNSFFEKLKLFIEQDNEVAADQKADYFNTIKDKFQNTFSIAEDEDSELIIFEELNNIGITKMMLHEIMTGSEEDLKKRAISFLLSISKQV